MNNKKFYIAIVLLFTFAFGTEAFASLTFTTSAINASGNALTISTSGGGDQAININASGNAGLGIGMPGSTVARVVVSSLSASTPISSWILNGRPLLGLFSETSTTGDGDIIMLMASDTTRPRIITRRSHGTLAVPTAVATGDTLFSLVSGSYDGTSFLDNVGIDYVTEGTISTGNVPTAMRFSTGTGSNRIAAMSIDSVGRVTKAVSSRTSPAWGGNGIIESTGQGRTFTDSTSSGTVAVAIANTFDVPTFAAASPTTFTEATNLYVGGDINAGTNVTLSNSYGFVNSGKTRLDGNVGIGTGLGALTQKLEINGGVRLNTVTAKPVCSSTVRGTFWAVQSGAGVKDTVEVCAKDAGDVYAWRLLF